MERLLVTALTGAAVLLPVRAFAEGDVTVTLTANLMIAKHAGAEVSAPADLARPGDVIEYRARYRNQGPARVRGVAATLPIPAGTEYIARTATPAAQLASTDGLNFAPIPLRRRVRLADGTQVTQEVPAAEYRALRWTLGGIDAHREQMVRARVRVAATAVAAVVRH